MKTDTQIEELEREIAQSKEANAGLMRVCDNLDRELAIYTEANENKTDWCPCCKQGWNCAKNEQKHRQGLAEVTKQRDALTKALREMLKFTPRSLSCQDFHHTAKDYHSESKDCQPTKRFRDSWAKAEQALAATGGGSHE
jgi:hypothetical protein